MDAEFELGAKQQEYDGVKCVEDVRRFYETEKRVVRNWNEGLEGDPPAALLRALKGFEETKDASFFEVGKLGELCLARLQKCPCAGERRLLAYGLWAWYSQSLKHRKEIRLAFGKELRSFGMNPQWRWVIAPLLAALDCILQGIQKEDLTALWTQCLGPLYRPSEFAEWRDQLPLLGTYHKELTACSLSLCRASEHLGGIVLSGVLEAWPTTSSASTSKEVLLVDTLEQLICAKTKGSKWTIADSEFEPVLAQVLRRLALCAASENWRLCERGLHIWRRPEITERLNRKETITAYTPALLRDGTPHWNPTVNRMTLLVLDHLAAIDFEYLSELADVHFATKSNDSTRSEMISASDFRGWRPDSNEAPPVTITGAAPWAKRQQTSEKKEDSNPMTLTDFRAACSAMSREETKHAEYNQAWAAALVSKAPERLPSLKFHDLVFGRELGQGAFGVVKYAKRIVRDISREVWPELAVKVVTRSKLKEHNYESSVAREICALRILDHPGIARLVSSFKWREDIYLVLEYAANSDLHCDIRDRGALDLASIRFVIGSIVSALISIHGHSLVFADLKPENVLITAAGHLKLTDFGGCRGATTTAARDLEFKAAKALNELRDGDWRPSSLESQASSRDEIGASLFEDSSFLLQRVEGTLLYAPPEVCRGQLPSVAADVWALACVAHFCAEAKPRIEAESDDEAKKIILALQDPSDLLFADTTPTPVCLLEKACLVAEPKDRPALQTITTMPLLAPLTLDTIYEAPAPPLTRANPQKLSTLGTIRAPDDARWAQRQYSMIWAPLDSGDTSPKSQNTVSQDVLGPWLNLGPIPAKSADLNLPFIESYSSSSLSAPHLHKTTTTTPRTTEHHPALPPTHRRPAPPPSTTLHHLEQTPIIEEPEDTPMSS